MNLPAEIPALGKTLFMAAANRQAVLVTRTGKRMRQRAGFRQRARRARLVPHSTGNLCPFAWHCPQQIELTKNRTSNGAKIKSEYE